MGGSGSRSAQELHRSPPSTRLQSLDPPRRQLRASAGPPKCRNGPQQQWRRAAAQSTAAAVRKGDAPVGRLRAGCESFLRHGDVAWPAAQPAGVRAQEGRHRHRCLQTGDTSFLWKTPSRVFSETDHLTAEKQRLERPPPGQRGAPPAARKSAAPATARAAQRCPVARPPPPPPPPPPEPPPAPLTYRPDAGPRVRACRVVSASYAGSTTSSRSSLAAPGDSGISSSPSRASLECRLEVSEGEKRAKPRTPRPPAWKVRGIREDQIPNDLHRRFCEEVKSRYQLQTEEDHRRRLLAIKQVDDMVSERMASSVGREIPAPHSRLQQGPKMCWAPNRDKGAYGRGIRSSSSERRSTNTSAAEDGKFWNSKGKKVTHSGRDDSTTILGGLPMEQYPKYIHTNHYRDSLQKEAEGNHRRSLNSANFRQLSENYSLENSHEQRHLCDTLPEKLTMKTSEIEKDHAHKDNACMNYTKEKETKPDRRGVSNVREETGPINRTVDVSEFQTMTKAPQSDPRQSDSKNAEGKASVQSSTTSDSAERALIRKDKVVMQLLMGGYFTFADSRSIWPRVGMLRRTSNQLDVSIRSCSDPVEKQSVETQTLPVHVSRRLQIQEQRLEFAPKIEIDHRGSRTRYYGLRRDGSMGSLLSNGTPMSSPRPQAGNEARLPVEDRGPSCLVLERPPPSPERGSQRIHGDHTSHDRVPDAQWITPSITFPTTHSDRHSSSGNSTSSGDTRGLALNPERGGNSVSHHRNTSCVSMAVTGRRDHSRGDYQAVEQERKSHWSDPVSHSRPHQLCVNEAWATNDQRFSSNKSNAETTHLTHRLALSDSNPLIPEEELNSISLDTTDQYNPMASVGDRPAQFSRAGGDRSMQCLNPNSHANELHHLVDHWGEDETKRKHHANHDCHENVHRRCTPRHPRYSRHRRNIQRRTKHEDKFEDSESGSEERIVQHNRQSRQRVVEKSNQSNSCLKKGSSDSVDNELLGDCKGDDKRHWKHDARRKRIVKDEQQEQISDDGHVRSNGPCSDSVTKSCTTYLCRCRREQEHATSLEQCNARKFVPDGKNTEKRDSRRRVDESLRKPSAAAARNADCRVKQESPYDQDILRDGDIRQCRSSCCCTCHQTLGRARLQTDVSGRQATHVAKRAQCSAAASTPENPCGCREQRSAQCEAGSCGCGLCSACRREARNRGDGLGPGKRCFHECYCGSRRVCYSILEDDEETAAAEEAQGSGRGFVHALSFFQNRSTGEWSQ